MKHETNSFNPNPTVSVETLYEHRCTYINSVLSRRVNLCDFSGQLKESESCCWLKTDEWTE